MAATMLVVLFKAPTNLSWLPGWLDEISEMFGYALLVTATLWRIWCALFIAGTKNFELSSEGPYSVVRNPLYLGNFLGVVGFGFAVEQPLLGLALGLVFILGYPAVVAQEERSEERRVGKEGRSRWAASDFKQRAETTMSGEMR